MSLLKAISKSKRKLISMDVMKVRRVITLWGAIQKKNTNPIQKLKQNGYESNIAIEILSTLTIDSVLNIVLQNNQF